MRIMLRRAVLAAAAAIAGIWLAASAEAACPGPTAQANLYASNRGYTVGGWVGCDSGGTIVPGFTLFDSSGNANDASHPVYTSSSAALSQGSTLSGQKGTLDFGSVTTSAPSYTAGQVNPLSLDPFGALRVLLMGPTGAAIDPTTPALSQLQTIQSAGTTTPGNVTGCDSSVLYDASTNGATQLVALSASKTVYVCGYTINSGGTVTVKLETGTGTACATGETAITPAYSLVAQGTVSDSSAFYRGLKGSVSSALCIKTNAAVAVQAIVYYTQYQ